MLDNVFTHSISSYCVKECTKSTAHCSWLTLTIYFNVELAEGNPGKHELTVIEFKNMEDLKGEDMPKPSRMLSAKQKDGKKLPAADIYKKTWQWLEKRGCAVFVPQELLERYAMSAARWIQCEQAVTELWLSRQASDDRAGDPEPVCRDVPELHDSDLEALERDFPGGKGELLDRVQRGEPAG